VVRRFARAVLGALKRSGPGTRRRATTPVAPAGSPGHAPAWSLDRPLAEFPVEKLDHLVHALHTSGRLAALTPDQAHNVLYALHATGHFGYYAHPDTITYNDDGLVAVHKDTSFLAEPRFRAAYEAGRATGSWGSLEPRWRVHVLCWAAERALGLEGDFVECGVNRGANALAVVRYLDFAALPRRFYLLDTFCGFPASQRGGAAECDRGRYTECYEEVRQTFREVPNAVLVRGAVPDTLPQVDAGRVAFLSIDMNCAEPEIAAAEFFWDRLAGGAAVVLDDYACGPWYELQRRAFDEFARARGVRVLPLPTGQGLIFKP
jgi:hypothetical protein